MDSVTTCPTRQNISIAMHSVNVLPVHSASFAHNFVSGMQSFSVPRCNSIADLSLKIVFWSHKYAVGLIDVGNSESQDP